jgi:D-glycero-D-manno-heptose 1,7-bisphosphate phosphatase
MNQLKNSILQGGWSLFLDRDGVINSRIPDDYVKRPEELVFLPGVLEALQLFDGIFERIVVVTNQQGIGRGFMTSEDLKKVHEFMLQQVTISKGRIDKVYFCPDLKQSRSFWRKPAVGMGLAARKDFPEIRFKQCVMAGDSASDMLFGKRLGMITVFIGNNKEELNSSAELIDHAFPDLISFARMITHK